MGLPRLMAGSFTLRRGDRLGHFLSATGKKKNAGHDHSGGRSLLSSFRPALCATRSHLFTPILIITRLPMGRLREIRKGR